MAAVKNPIDCRIELAIDVELQFVPVGQHAVDDLPGVIALRIEMAIACEGDRVVQAGLQYLVARQGSRLGGRRFGRRFDATPGGAESWQPKQQEQNAEANGSQQNQRT